MFRTVHIAALELKRYAVDKGALAFGVALPIALFALMYSVFSGEGFNGTANIVDLDGGPMSQQLVARLRNVDGLELDFYTEAEADRALDRSKIVTAAVIPAGFSDDLQAGLPVTLTIKQRGSGGDEGQIAMAIVRGVAERLAGDSWVRAVVRDAMTESSLPQDQIDATVDELLDQARAAPLIGFTSTVMGGRDEFLDRLLPGILVMFLMFAVTLNAQAMVAERQLGTLERLLTTRLGTNELFLGKFLAGTARAGLQAMVLLSLGFAVLTIAGPGTFFVALAMSLLVAAAVSAIGLVIGAFARTQNQAIWGAVFITMFMTIFGGTFFDVGESGALALLSKFTFTKYAVDLLEGVIYIGPGALADHGVPLAVLSGVSVVGLVAARSAFRVVEGGR